MTQLSYVQIHVKMLKTVTLDVNCTDTVDQIKSKFSTIEGIDKSMQELFFAGIHLKNHGKVADYNIMPNSSVELYVTDRMQISVDIPSDVPSDGKTIRLNMKKSNKVVDVKAEIEQKEGIPINRQMLIYEGRHLENNHMLSQCGLTNDPALLLLVRPTDNLHVFVNVGDKRFVSLTVKCWHTVAIVKSMIDSLEGLPAWNQILMQPRSGVDVVLKDSKTLQAQGVKNNDILILQQKVQHMRNNQTVQVFIRPWEGKTVTMFLNLSDRVEEVMKKIEEKLLIKEGIYYLCYQGHHLSSFDTLQKHGVKRHSTITIRLRLRDPNPVKPRPGN